VLLCGLSYRSSKNFSVHSLILTGVIFGFYLLVHGALPHSRRKPRKNALVAHLAYRRPLVHGHFPYQDSGRCNARGRLRLILFLPRAKRPLARRRKKRHLGMETGKVKKLVFITASLITGACVSASGIIGVRRPDGAHLMRKLIAPTTGIFCPPRRWRGGIPAAVRRGGENAYCPGRTARRSDNSIAGGTILPLFLLRETNR